MDKYLSVAEQVFSGMRYRYENGEHVIDFDKIIPVDVKFISGACDGRLYLTGVHFGFYFGEEYYCEFEDEIGKLSVYYLPDDIYCEKPCVMRLCYNDGEILDEILDEILKHFNIKEKAV